MIGEQLVRLRRELAYLDHDLIVDGGDALCYCVHCHVGDFLRLRPLIWLHILHRARHHHAACAARRRRQGTNGGTDAGAPA